MDGTVYSSRVKIAIFQDLVFCFNTGAIIRTILLQKLAPFLALLELKQRKHEHNHPPWQSQGEPFRTSRPFLNTSAFFLIFRAIFITIVRHVDYVV
jgi:hypothetical protein